MRLFTGFSSRFDKGKNFPARTGTKKIATTSEENNIINGVVSDVTPTETPAAPVEEAPAPVEEVSNESEEDEDEDGNDDNFRGRIYRVTKDKSNGKWQVKFTYRDREESKLFDTQLEAVDFARLAAVSKDGFNI